MWILKKMKTIDYKSLNKVLGDSSNSIFELHTLIEKLLIRNFELEKSLEQIKVFIDKKITEPQCENLREK